MDSVSKSGPKEVRDLGGFPGIILETVPTPDPGVTVTYVAMLEHLRVEEVEKPYPLTDFSYDRPSRTARILPKASCDWITVPLSIIESRSKR